MEENLYDIETSLKLLINKFNDISKKGWFIKKTNNPGEFGNNLEYLLGKKTNNLQVPDFGGIEIKTKKENSYDKYITLFNLTPIGESFFEIKRLKDNYGYPDIDLKDCKVLNGNIFCKNKNKIGAKFYFQLDINYEQKKISLLIFDKNNNLVDDSTFWTFKMLKQRIDCKLNYLALIKVKTKKINFKKYYKYETVNIYKLKGLEEFLLAIKNDYIRIQLKIGVFKTGKRIRQIHDRGTGFQINENHINSIYKNIYTSKKTIEN